MNVIGAGFGRTGTMSLKAALEQLGFGPSLHMMDIALRPELIPRWQSVVDGDDVDWTELLDGWESTVDWPACSYWEPISEAFPDAKVLLSVRDPGAWYASCLNTIYASASAARKGELTSGVVSFTPEMLRLIDSLAWDGTFEGRFEDKGFAIDTFNRHNQDVTSRVPAERLLVYEIAHGWEPLCEFLDVPIPDGPMPHLNDASTFRTLTGLASSSS